MVRQLKNILDLSGWERCFLVPAILLFCVFSGIAAKEKEDYFITFDLEKKSLYEREAVLGTLTLHSRDANIAFSEMVVAPELEKGNFGFIRSVASNLRPEKEEIDGEIYYSIPLKSYIIALHDKGTYTISGGKFKIGTVKREYYNDPFWGRRVAERVVPVIVDVKPKQIKVKALPGQNGVNYSGLVGDFDVKTIIPRGDIILNEPSTALIKIQGKGLIGEDILPDYAGAFKKGVKLKSMSESRDIFFDGKSAVSELVLECEFIPTEKSAEIGIVELDFFNPATGKFEKASSEITKVEVKSITSKIETIEI